MIHGAGKPKGSKLLRESETGFRELFEKSPDPCWIINEENLFVLCNQAAADMLGYDSVEELRATHPSKLSPETQPDGRESFEKANEMMSLAYRQGVHRFEWEHQRKNGESFPVEVTLARIELDGKAQLYCVWRDISERKAYEAELRITQFSLDHAPDAVFWMKPDGTFTYVNEVACRRLGYTREELLTMGVADIDPDHPDGIPKWMAESTREKGFNRIQSVHRTKDGGLIPVDIMVAYINYGGREHHCAFVRDISDIKQKEEGLEQALRFRSQLLDQAAEGICLWHLSNTDTFAEFLVWNRRMAEITGYSREEINRLGWLETMYADAAQRETARYAMQDVLDGNTNRGNDFRVVSKGGQPKVLHISSSPVRGEEDEPCVLAVIEDVTEQRELEEKYRQAQKMEAVGTLVGGIAHDFNNILAAIQGNLYLARLELQENPIVVEKLANIERLGSRAAEMVQQLLTFARKDHVAMHVFSLSSFVNEGYRLAKTLIPENIEQHIDTQHDGMRIQGDATQLQQMLMNLLSNAVDAVSEVASPKIGFSLSKYVADDLFAERHALTSGKPYACLAVSDNGHGISSSDLEKIFEPFFTTKEIGKGTGLGLAMVYGAVQTHGGAVEVESRPGEGTTFRVYLPLYEGNAEDEPAKVVASYQANGETILLVDDQEELRKTTAKVLARFGYRVLEAHDGQQALLTYRQQPDAVDLVISDVIMPKMGGVELLKSVRAFNAELPFILVTGYDKQRVILEEVESGGCLVVNKPFDFKKLSMSIQELVRDSKKRP